MAVNVDADGEILGRILLINVLTKMYLVKTLHFTRKWEGHVTFINTEDG